MTLLRPPSVRPHRSNRAQGPAPVSCTHQRACSSERPRFVMPQPDNGIVCRPFFGDIRDTVLQSQILPTIQHLSTLSDVSAPRAAQSTDHPAATSSAFCATGHPLLSPLRTPPALSILPHRAGCRCVLSCGNSTGCTNGYSSSRTCEISPSRLHLCTLAIACLLMVRG